MKDDLEKAIASFKEVKKILEGFTSREEAVMYLVKMTDLPYEECERAYDIFVNSHEKINDKSTSSSY